MSHNRSSKLRIRLPKVSLGGPTLEPSLPLPWVLFPGHYGTFFAFAAGEGKPWRLCACTKRALGHLICLNHINPPHKNSNPLRMLPLDSLHVPSEIAELSRSGSGSPLAQLSFERGLCHLCTQHVPSLRYCHEMYGGAFTQGFGWYIKQAFLRAGVYPRHPYHSVDGTYPNAVRSQVTEYSALWKELYAASGKNLFSDPNYPERQALEKCKRAIENHFTDVARLAFGFHRIGEGWVSETLLASIVRELLPTAPLQRHYRPDWLGGLELDIYLPTLSVALEYQGQQHAQPVGHFGGEPAFVALRKRDARKKRLSRERGVTLIEVWYDDALSREAVGARLREAGINC